ncbi:MAG: hypothetical protein ACTHMS_18190 [Jatrophihabitans sp.]|uniref:hypothetical protein n=1 Tax=Jatrophihabitans sp. TaxID=1932789 RepID=UPI003F80A02D
MSETLYQEGEELEQLLAELDERHPGKVHVLSVSYPRSGGVMGFFARERVGVEYEITDETPLEDHLSGLLEAAEGAEHLHGVLPPVRGADVTDEESLDHTNAEFASMLLEMARDKQGGRVNTRVHRSASRNAVPANLPTFEPVSAPSLDAADFNHSNGTGAAMTQTATTGTPNGHATPTHTLPNVQVAPPVPLTVEHQPLLDLGIPERLLPGPGVDPYRAVAELSRTLPGVTLPTGRGVVIAVAGPRSEALKWADNLRERAGLRPEDVVEPTTLLQAAEIRLSGESAIVLIDTTDEHDPLMPKPTAGALLGELRPTQLWAILDGSRKLSDLEHEVETLQVRPDALIVNRLNRTASPASVWSFDIPVAFMDNDPATPTRWAALLLDRLGDAGV